MDPKNRTADFMQFGDLFNRGIAIAAESKAKTMFFDLPGQQHMGVIWKHQEQRDPRYLFSPPEPYVPPSAGAETLWDSWGMYYGLDQYVMQFSDSPDRGWGLFGRASMGTSIPT